MKTLLHTIGLALALGSLSQSPAQAARSPFVVTATMALSNDVPRATFTFQVPPEHVLYADRLAFETEDGSKLTPASIPGPVAHRDSITGRERAGYDRTFTADLDLQARLPLTVVVRFQGCSNSACYFPDWRTFQISAPGTVTQVDAPPPALAAAGSGDSPPQGLIDTNGFKVVARETGFVAKAAFVKFLKASKSSEGAAATGSRFEAFGPVATLLLILLGGLGVHKFILGYTNAGIIMVAVTVVSYLLTFVLIGIFGILAMSVIGVVEGIIYLTKSDDEFVVRYGVNKKSWF